MAIIKTVKTVDMAQQDREERLPPCPGGVDFVSCGCRDHRVVELEGAPMEDLGRVIRVSVTLRCVCPGKRVAAAVVLTELGPNGEEYARGMRSFTVPAHREAECRDILLKCVTFVVPEDLRECGCSFCCRRKFRVRLLANYVDTDFICCQTESTLV